MNIVGQEKLLKTLESLKANFPRFIVLEGKKGSGKKVIAEQISKLLEATLIKAGTSAEEVRETVYLSYRVAAPTVYVIPDAEEMSVAAKNALLKVTEEPPEQAYFILTTNNLRSVLSTLRSRATCLKMNDYSYEELNSYIQDMIPIPEKDEVEILLSVCENINDIDVMRTHGIRDFYNFCQLVANNVCSADLSNVLKINQKLRFKDDATEGYDAELFLRVVSYIFGGMLKDNINYAPNVKIFANMIKITSKYISELNITGINKSATVDSWIFSLRGI
jgi:DNA polymerase III delta prime subunit